MSNKNYILSRSLDLWITGLGSILLVLIILLIDPKFGNLATFGDVLVFTTIINGAHFMASYRMLYHTKAMALRYKNASIYMPFFLVSYCLLAVYLGESYPIFVSAILIVTSLYLALHYTGQTWGMMSTLAFLDGVKLDEKEKKYFRISLKFLMFWQLVWSLKILDPKPEWLSLALSRITPVPYILIAAAISFGSVAIVSLFKRQNTLRLRMLVPYVAIYFWYALLSINYLALPLIQFFHALQYLIFPLRVELNRSRAGDVSAEKHIAEYILIMCLLGGLGFVLIPYYFKNFNPEFAGAIQVFIAAINIHHFYIDGYIWKISQPVVKDELFAHLKA